MPNDLAALIFAQPDTDSLLHDRGCDFVLHEQHVRSTTIVGAAPYLHAAAHIHELRFDQQPPGSLCHSPNHDGVDSELSPNLTWVKTLFLEVEDGASSHDLERRQARNPLDQAVGNTVAEVFGVLVLREVDKRQYCHRPNSRFIRPQRPGGEASYGAHDCSTAQPHHAPSR